MAVNMDKNDIAIDVKTNKKGKSDIFLKGDLTIYTVRQAYESLKKIFKASSVASIDLSGVSKVDAAGYQLLLATRRDCPSADEKVLFDHPSVAVTSIFTLFGEEVFL
jgi:ABC-type transporter Mla MlaB component